MRNNAVRALVLTPLALSALLVACSGGDDGDDGTTDKPQSLQERLFAGSQADSAKREQLVRECMLREGFEYTPVDLRSQGNVAPFDPNSEEFVKERGFGVSTMFANEIQFTPPENPNTDYRDSLSDAQKAAYDKALYGITQGTFDAGGGAVFSVAGGGGPIVSGGPIGAAPVGGTTGDGNSVQAVQPQGCIGEALKATGQDQPAFDTSLFDDLQDLEKRIKADPEMVEAMKKWSTCMDKAGYKYRDRDEAISEIRKEFADLTGLEISGDGGGFAISVSAIGGVDGESGQAFDPLANVDKAKLSALQDKEKRIALASYECSQDSIVDVEAEVRERLEAEFIESHPDLKGSNP